MATVITGKLKDPYVNLRHGNLNIVVKLDDEGVVIDLYDEERNADEPIDSTWKLYTEMEEGEEED